ncbi:MAG: DUF4230 domain-containing protein, partial [Armatimonadota bacterium]|nr:DUF4230 domain-containing protein [Armatimonadota bacterium]
VDEENSRVYDRYRGWLVWKPNPDLERQARLQALADARRGAMQNGMMDAARANAEENLRALLEPLGVKEIRFEWGPSTAAEAGGEAAPAG